MQPPPIVHSTYITVPPSRVYRALTDGREWDAWFTYQTELDPRPGGRILFRWRDFGLDHIDLEDGGPVLEAVPDRKFCFQWNPGPRPTTVEITLEPLGEGTRLTLRESGFALEEEDLAALVQCASGWGEALTLFKFYLEHDIRPSPIPRR